MAIQLRHPFTMIISGPTQAGKSTFVRRLIENAQQMIDVPPGKILYCHKGRAPVDLPLVSTHRGVPSPNLLEGNCGPALVILDDLMSEINGDAAELFTRLSHHEDISVIMINQNLFPRGPHARTISLNAQYIVVFKNPRDVGQFSHLARQMYGGSKKGDFAIDAFNQATLKAHGYLFVDLKPETDDNYRLRTDVFPGEQTFVFVDRKLYKPTGWGL